MSSSRRKAIRSAGLWQDKHNEDQIPSYVIRVYIIQLREILGFSDFIWQCHYLLDQISMILTINYSSFIFQLSQKMFEQIETDLDYHQEIEAKENIT